jgi:hypothetical protein
VVEVVVVVVVVVDLWVGIIRRWRVERVAVGLRKGQMAGGIEPNY